MKDKILKIIEKEKNYYYDEITKSRANIQIVLFRQSIDVCDSLIEKIKNIKEK